MRKILILASGALTFGLAAGYAWSAMTAPAPRAHRAGKPGFMALPASPEERPAALDKEWETRADPATSDPVAQVAAVRNSGCNEVRAAGKAPLYQGDPGYRSEMDGDSDGIACEPIRGH